MNNAKTIRRALGFAAPVALTLALAAPFAGGAESVPDHLWEAKVNKVPHAWVNPYGECWESVDGPSGLPPCVVDIPEEITVRLNFEFDMYRVPDNVVNQNEIARIDEYIDQLQATPENEFVTIVGHTDAKGSDEYNMALGQRRADAVRDYIIRRGYPAQNVGPAESRGKRQMIPGVDPFSVEQRRVVLTKSEA